MNLLLFCCVTAAAAATAADTDQADGEDGAAAQHEALRLPVGAG